MNRDEAATSPGGQWPAVDFEELTWTPTHPPELIPRAVLDRLRAPYRAAVVAPIAHRNPVLPNNVLALADDASAAISRFDAELGSAVAPFGAILLRTESASSSRIENLSSGAKAIAVADLGGGKRNAAEIIDNVRAMQTAVDLAHQLDETAVLDMHRALMTRLHPEIAGTWRDQLVWIGGDGYGPHGADHVAPHHSRVTEAMADLMAFARRNDLPVLVQAAITHAQFETIHPFPDGNGRTGRALLHAMLRNKGLTRNVTIPVSAGLLTQPERYFAALTRYREGDLAAIVEDVANATFAAISNGRMLAGDIDRVRAEWAEQIKARRDAAAWRLVDLALQQPVFDTATVSHRLGIPAASARTAIETLVAAGVVTEFTGYRRNRMWQAGEVLAALDGFAARAGRRRTH